MNRYEFTITLSGCGDTPTEGWADACDTIYNDSQFDIYDTNEVKTVVTDTDIDNTK